MDRYVWNPYDFNHISLISIVFYFQNSAAKLSEFATENNLQINADVRDVETYPPGNPPPATLSTNESPEYIRYNHLHQ